MTEFTPDMFDGNTSPDALSAWEAYRQITVNPETSWYSQEMREQDAFTAGFDVAIWEPREQSPIEQKALEAVLWFFDSEGSDPGKFTASLLEAMAHADATNLARLVRAFPQLGHPFLIAKSHRDGLAVLRGLAQVATV